MMRERAQSCSELQQRAATLRKHGLYRKQSCSLLPFAIIYKNRDSFLILFCPLVVDTDNKQVYGVYLKWPLTLKETVLVDMYYYSRIYCQVT
eukprot:m.343257 g.343257  ORF g.343257 m.343257 type:complete len:92 (+) comp22566_c0_seq1:949-1224(+)